MKNGTMMTTNGVLGTFETPRHIPPEDQSIILEIWEL
jgi:hypothetical protein